MDFIGRLGEGADGCGRDWVWEGLGGDGMEGESVWRDDWNWGAFEGGVET